PASSHPYTLSLHDALPIFARYDAPAALQVGDHLRLGAGSDDDVLGGQIAAVDRDRACVAHRPRAAHDLDLLMLDQSLQAFEHLRDRKSTRLNSSHLGISYA